MRYAYLVPAAVALVILAASVTYVYVVPRTGLTVTTVYHETPGGGGTGGVINVNVLLDNSGNRDVSSLSFEVRVLNASGEPMTGQSGEGISLGPGRSAEVRLSFVGSQYDSYAIGIHLRFDSGGDTTISDISHETREDEMNLVFRERLP